MKKSFLFISAFIAMVLIPQVVLAAWWNPFTWFKKDIKPAPQTTTYIVDTHTVKTEGETKNVPVKPEVSQSRTSQVYTNEKYGFTITPKQLSKITEKQDSVWFEQDTSCTSLRCPGGFIQVRNLLAGETLESIKDSTLATWQPDLVVSGERSLRGISNEGSGQPFVVTIHNGKVYWFAWDLAQSADIRNSFKFTR